MEKIGKVIRIISDDKLIVNLGNDILSKGDEIEIFENTEQEIIDPETNEKLGYYRIVKDTLNIIHVDKKFSIAETKRIPVETSDTSESLINMARLLTWNIRDLVHYEQKRLNIDEKDINYLDIEGDKKIKVGDLVFKKEIIKEKVDK